MKKSSILKLLKTKKSDWELLEIYNIEADRNGVDVKMKHKCGYINTYKYNYFTSKQFKGCSNCEDVQERIIYTKESFQERIDNEFGKGNIILKDFTKAKAKAVYTCGKCGNDFVYTKAINLFTSGAGCPHCRDKAVIKLPEIKQKLKEKFGNRIVYVDGYINGLEDNCKFKFTKCGHEFENKMVNILRLKSTLYCEECNEFGRRKLEEYNRQLQPFYTAKEIDFDKRTITATCNICNANINLSTRNVNVFKRCNCEDNIRNEIADSYIDLMLFGKSYNLSKYLKNNMDKVLDFNKFKITDYYFSESSNNDIIEMTDSINLRFKDKILNAQLHLPHKKIHMQFNNLTLKVSDGSKLILKECYALQLNDFNIDKIFYIIYDTATKKNLTTKIVIRNGYNTNANEFQKSRKINSLAITVISKLIMIINREEDFRTTEEYESETLLNKDYQQDKENNVTTKVELRHVKFDLHRKITKIVNKGHSNRKIGCNFTVSGHYRTYEKTGKRIFINSFEKGKEYKNIRRIEKNYVVK